MQAISNNCPALIQAEPEKVLGLYSKMGTFSDTNPSVVLDSARKMGEKSKQEPSILLDNASSNGRIFANRSNNNTIRHPDNPNQNPAKVLENDAKNPSNFDVKRINLLGLSTESGNEIVHPLFVDAVFNSLDLDELTRKEYAGRFRAFAHFVKQDGSLHLNSFVNFKRHLAQNNQLSPSTKNKLLTVARLFLRELHRRNLIPTDITNGVKGFRQDKKHKRTGLVQEDIDAIRHWITTHRPKTQCKTFERVLSVLLLLTYHGLRQVEITRLDVADFRPAEGLLFVHGKGADDKTKVLLHPDVVSQLKKYIEVYSIADGTLFFSLSNNSYGRRISVRSLRAIVSSILDELAIDKTVHGFRHYYVTRLLEEFDGDVIKTMKYTRHKSVEMMVVYNDAIDLLSDKPRHDGVFANTLVEHTEVAMS